MKEYVRHLIEKADGDLARACLVREYLQARILQALQDRGAFLRWAILGGTALRFLYAIPRFSEDLDFSLLTPGTDAAFRPAMSEVRHALEAEGYRMEVKVADQKTVASAFVMFPGLPYELGLSPRPSQILSVKVELDTNPPPGAVVETSIVRRHVTLNLCHYDQASLLAGKLHAILSRPWTKGRDLYDLVWYLADRTWPEPNLVLLNAALAQTGWSDPEVTSATWRKQVRERIGELDLEQARADVRPFLERVRDLDLITLDGIGRLLR